MRRIAGEFLDHAHVGETIDIEGKSLPYRPVAVSLGKTVNNGWGGFECVWARTMLAALVGGLEVPGGTLGTTVRLNRQVPARVDSVLTGPDGFMEYPLNPTDKARWSPNPNIRNAYRTMVPLAANGPWSQALGPTHFSWMFLDETPKGLPRVTLPDVWFVYRTNPAISFWDTDAVGDRMARFPFMVAFAYTLDETNHHADILLPEATDLESLQLIRIGGSKFVEQFWDCTGFALRQPAVATQGDARDFTAIATELARRTGLLEKYNASINKGAAGVPLKGAHWDVTLDARDRTCARADLGRRLSRGERGAHRRHANRTASTGGASMASRPSRSRAPSGICIRRSSRRDCASSSPIRSACCASAPSSAGACTSTTCTGGTSSCPNTRRCRSARTSGCRGSRRSRRPAARRRIIRSGC